MRELIKNEYRKDHTFNKFVKRYPSYVGNKCSVSKDTHLIEKIKRQLLT